MRRWRFGKRARLCPSASDDWVGRVSGDGFRLGDACLELNATRTPKSDVFYLFAQSEECEGCDLSFYASIKGGTAGRFLVNSTFPSIVAVRNETGEVCRVTYHFGQSGTYRLGWNETSCEPLDVVHPPENIYLPLLFAASLVTVACVLKIVGGKLFGKFRSHFQRQHPNLRAGSDPPYAQVAEHGGDTREAGATCPEGIEQPRHRVERLASLDCFRGLAIIIMIFVNYGGGQYWFFAHSTWNGVTVADLPFPWFMWVMGVSTFLSLESRHAKHFSKSSTFVKSANRSIILFMLGLMINSMCWKNDLRTLRIPGVLQRFALVYFVVATFELLCLPPEGFVKRFEKVHPTVKFMGDILVSWKQGLFVSGMILLHCSLIFLLPVPGCPRGYLGPGGMHQGGNFSNCTGGATGYIDRLIFSSSHVYQNPTSKVIYNSSIPFDPEGLVGCLTSILLVCMGVHCGKMLKVFPSWKERVLRLLAWAVISGIASLVLCGGTKNDGWIPLNKNLWSLSYVFGMAGLSFIFIAVAHVVIDVKKWWTGAPFIYAGMNPIILYVGHEMTAGVFPFQFGPLPETHLANLSMNLWGVSAWTVIAYRLHKNKFYLAL